MTRFTASGKQKIVDEILATEPGKFEPGRFAAYFNLLDDLAQRGTKFAAGVGRRPNDVELRAARDLHEEVLEVAAVLKSNPALTKDDVIQGLRQAPRHAQPSQPSDSEFDMLVNLAVQGMVMVDTSAREWHASGFTRGGHRPISWLAGDSFVDFLDRSFPRYVEDIDEDEDLGVKVALAEKSKLKAWKLRRRLGLEIRATDNLAEHLLVDLHKNRLYLFHHASFLKAHLDFYQGDKQALTYDMSTSLKRGTLPPQLLLETLHSLQDIIFPSIDDVSAHILDRLIARPHGAFDTECASYEGYPLPSDNNGRGGGSRGDQQSGLKYVYWGRRLVYLHGLLGQRLPRNRIERWFREQSSEGNAYAVAMMALVITIVVGVVCILLTAAQTAVAILAWKYPVAPAPA